MDISINIRCFLHHLGEIQHHLDIHKPHAVFFEEAWLNKRTEAVEIPGYRELSRKARIEFENRGDIISYVRNDIRNMAHLFGSDDAERAWYMLHTDVGILVVAN